MKVKKFIILIVILISFCIPSSLMAAGIMWAYDGTTGGTAGKIDNIDQCNSDKAGRNLVDKDGVIAWDQAAGKYLFYIYNAASTDAESGTSGSETVIEPNYCDGGAIGPGRWIQVDPDEMLRAGTAETLTQPWDLANSDCDTCTVIPLDSDFSSNGIMVRTGAGVYGIGTTFDIDLTAGAVLEGDSGGKAAIKTSIWKHMNVPISNANPDGTNCEAVASISAGSSDFNALASQCDNDAVGNFKFAVPMPENWDGADAVDELKVMIHWGVNVGDPTSTQTVSWDAKFCSASHGEPLGTWVNATIVTHTFVADDAQYDHYVTELSADTAIVGAAGDMLWIAIWRDTGVDTYAEYVQVYGFTIYYKTDDLDAMD